MPRRYRAAGTTQSSIARLESGRTSPSTEDVIRLLRLTGFDLRVELVPDDDSDRNQAELEANPDQRLGRLVRLVALLGDLRSEVLGAH